LSLALAPTLAAQPADVEQWVTVRSPNFTVHSDATPERAAEIVASLERFRSVFSQFAGEIELRSPAPTRIFAFRDEQSYAPYKGGNEGSGRVLGQFLSHRDGNYITLNSDPRYLGAFSVIYHEYVHYLVLSNFPTVPMWFNEGLAEYYSTLLTEGDAVYLGQPVERHMRWLLANSEFDVEGVLAVGREGAGSNEAHGAGRFYAVSWILVHYLLSDEVDRSDDLASYFTALAQGAEPRGAFIDAFGLRASELEEQLHEYVRAGSLPVAALSLDRVPAGEQRVSPAAPDEVLVGLGDLLSHMGREEEAAQHLHLALDYAPDSGDAYAGLGYARDRQQRLAEADELYKQAMELVPQSATSYLLYGRHLMTLVEGGGLVGDGSDRKPLAERARWALAAATEIDPLYGEAWAMRGVAHLLTGGDVEEGIPHLERARELLPGRGDLLLHLVRLYVRADRDDAAWALTEGELSRVAKPEEVAAAREEIERWGLVRGANEALKEGEVEEGLRLFDQAISVTSDPDLRRQMEEQLVALRARLEGES
jgi:tetratricopeptide (TPR) repeat protein